MNLPVRWLNLRPNQELSETWLRTRSHTLRHLFLPTAVSLAFSQSEDGVYLRTRSGGNIFNLACLRAKTKARKFLIRKILFEDGAALTAHTEGNLRQLTSSFAHACSEFGIKISLTKTNILCQDVSSTPSKRAPLATTLLRWWRTSFTLAPPFSATSP